MRCRSAGSLGMLRFDTRALFASGCSATPASVQAGPQPPQAPRQQGVRKLEVKPKTRRNRRGRSGQGKTGRVNANEPSMRPRDPQLTGIDGFHGEDGSTTVAGYSHDALLPPERSQDGQHDPGVQRQGNCTANRLILRGTLDPDK